jgi:hypothetical protein
VVRRLVGPEKPNAERRLILEQYNLKTNC